MTINKGKHVEVVTSVKRRRRCAMAEKRAMVQGTYETGITLSAVARKYGLVPNQLFDCAGAGGAMAQP